MGDNRNKYRLERKFYVTDLSYVEIEHLLRLHPSLLREIYHKRMINNIYFDTHDYRFLHENVAGIADRTKVRIRWYGNLFGTIENPVLEFKLKKGHVGTKKTFNLSKFVLDENLSAEKLKEWIQQGDMPDRIKEICLTLQPVLILHYGRKYLQSFDKQFRITLDDNVTYYKFLHGLNRLTNKKVEKQATIIELKYQNESDGSAFEISNLFPFRMTKSSKYVKGVENF